MYNAVMENIREWETIREWKKYMYYPRMTSFSDPKGIIHTVTMFHLKAEFL